MKYNLNKKTMSCLYSYCVFAACTDKKIKFSSYIKKIRRDRLQSNICPLYSVQYMNDELSPHIWLNTCAMRISSYFRKPLLIYGFATDPIWISLHMRKISFSFLSEHFHFMIHLHSVGHLNINKDTTWQMQWGLRRSPRETHVFHLFFYASEPVLLTSFVKNLKYYQQIW